MFWYRKVFRHKETSKNRTLSDSALPYFTWYFAMNCFTEVECFVMLNLKSKERKKSWVEGDMKLKIYVINGR